MTLINEIKDCIVEQLRNERNQFIIYPYGDVGMQVKRVLNECFGIEEAYIIDGELSKYNKKIFDCELFSKLECNQFAMIIATTNEILHEKIKEVALQHFPAKNISELASMKAERKKVDDKDLPATQNRTFTKVGRYSYGPLCNHSYVESVGAFTGIGLGCDVATNHTMDYLSLHPFLYVGTEGDIINTNDYEAYKTREWYFEGVKPKGKFSAKRIRIGNDVWLGRNVLITNYSNIGNGVIAGAGAVITKDVPDYAVVVGVPARIIRYRYTPDQIVALNEIKWWDWPDEIIRERYDDFYLPIEQFIEKYHS